MSGAILPSTTLNVTTFRRCWGWPRRFVSCDNQLIRFDGPKYRPKFEIRFIFNRRIATVWSSALQFGRKTHRFPTSYISTATWWTLRRGQKSNTFKWLGAKVLRPITTDQSVKCKNATSSSAKLVRIRKCLNPRRCLLTGEIPQVIESNNFFFYCKQQLLTLYYSGENL